MPVDDVLLDAEERMEKAVTHLADEYRGVRTGRASSGLVEHMKVEYYGSPTPLNQLANIGTPEPQLIVIKPYDPGCLKDIEKAILTSDLGITPQNDGKVIRLVIPPLSEERRKQLIHHAKELAEQAKISIRNVRRDANKVLDQEKKDRTIPEDEMYRGKDEVQELTNQYETKVQEHLTKKSGEIMQI
ncbi:MAG: ribosome recycling factor [Planctomycetes bacterium DG_58]|nr:MAG: ribosome recycling factor [Planctomycetes bacterium DG_58]